MPSVKNVTVEDASPSPPPLPNEPIPTSNVIDLPISTLGEGSDSDEEEQGNSRHVEDDEEVWDPAAEIRPEASSSTKKGKGKEKEEASKDAQPWQAVWAAEQNAWYFWNSVTGEVTWTNPLDPTASTSTTTPTPTPSETQPPLPTRQPPAPVQRFGALPEIDPSLAFLLPASQRSLADPTQQTAQFNARTGRFTANDYTYTVDHLDEYNRAKRMSSHYFDVDAWEAEKAREHAKRKREEELGITPSTKITKKDMERFKKKKAEQKARSQAWLRE